MQWLEWLYYGSVWLDCVLTSFSLGYAGAYVYEKHKARKAVKQLATRNMS